MKLLFPRLVWLSGGNVWSEFVQVYQIVQLVCEWLGIPNMFYKYDYILLNVSCNLKYLNSVVQIKCLQKCKCEPLFLLRRWTLKKHAIEIL